MKVLSEVDLTKKDEIEETVMMGLRLKKGISTSLFKMRFNEDLILLYPAIKKMIDEKVLIYKDNFLRIDPQFFYISNLIIKKILRWE